MHEEGERDIMCINKYLHGVCIEGTIYKEPMAGKKIIKKQKSYRLHNTKRKRTKNNQ